MLFFIKYGIARDPIDVGEFMIKWPSCETDQWADVMVSSVYSHVFYIPLFPSGKDAVVVCKKCGLRRYGVPFDSRLISNFHEVKRLYRHRLFTYTGAIIIALPFVLWLFFVIMRSVK